MLIQDDQKPKSPENDQEKESDIDLARKANVKSWLDKIDKAEKKWEADFDRMRSNMDFVYGLQWKNQKKLRTNRYVVNMTLRTVNQGVAMLYARDPQVEARRRPRFDFQIWDGSMETILQALIMSQTMSMAGLIVPPDMMALIQDFQMGRMQQKLVERVGKTLEYVYQYQCEQLQPKFKLQMKQLVRRVRTCGVGYIKVAFCRENDPEYNKELTHSETRLVQQDRLARIQDLVKKVQDGKIESTSAEVDQLKNLALGLGVMGDTDNNDPEKVKIKERLLFDFPAATAIIPDPCCRILKGFVGAHWVVEKFFYPLEFINAMYDKDIKIDSGVKIYGHDTREDEAKTNLVTNKDQLQKRVCVYQVRNLDDKTEFSLVKGYKDYLEEPIDVDPCTRSFWNIFPLTFNDTEVEDGCEATIFPPSDVDLLFSVQKERNALRFRQARHRCANDPKYVYPEGVLQQEDLDKLMDLEGQQFTGLKGLTPGMEPGKVLQALQVVPIQPGLYETEGLQEDALLASGQQEANLGPATPGVTATVGTIAEQSRMSVAGSDVDGLDDVLTEVAQCGGELLIREMSADTVKRIAGRGAVWPDTPESKEDFVNEIELKVRAASSGRPNKALEVANWERLAPLLIQAGANPQAIIRETIRRIDDQAEPADFFPVPTPPPPVPQEQAPEGGGKRNNSSPEGSKRKVNSRRQPLQPNMTGSAVPLAGA